MFSCSLFSNNSHPHESFLLLSLCLLQEFKTVAKEDTGRYSCEASNGVGQPKKCEGKHMTIGVCVFFVCVSTLSCLFPPNLSVMEKVRDAVERKSLLNSLLPASKTEYESVLTFIN